MRVGGGRRRRTNSATSLAEPLRESLWTLDLSLSPPALAEEDLLGGADMMMVDGWLSLS